MGLREKILQIFDSWRTAYPLKTPEDDSVRIVLSKVKPQVLAEIHAVTEKIRERLVEVSSKFAEATDNDVDDFLYSEDDKGDIFNVGGLGGKQSAFKEVLALLTSETEEA